MPKSGPDPVNEFFDISKAFSQYRNLYKERGKMPLTWKAIEEILTESGVDFNFGIGATNIKGFFGVGGMRAKKVLLPQHRKHQLAMLKVLNNKLPIKIRFDGEGKPIIKGGSFELEETKQETEPAAPEDEYDIFYWASDDRLGKGKLTLKQNKDTTATLDLYYPQNKVLHLTGRYHLTRGIMTVRLQDKEAMSKNPLSQLVYLFNEVSVKKFYYAVYSTAHRGANMYPVAGLMLLCKKDPAAKSPVRQHVENIASYILRKKRLDFKIGGFDLPDDIAYKKAFKITDAGVESWLQARRYEGTYEGQFVNPRRKTFETCFLQIKANGEIEMLVDANRDKRPFTGIARVDKQKEVLFILYDYQEATDSFRMTLRFDISGHHSETCDNLYGLMSGLELQSRQPISSSMVLKKMSRKRSDILPLGRKIEVYDLQKKDLFKKAEKKLKGSHLYDYFFGEEKVEFNSLALLLSFKKAYG